MKRPFACIGFSMIFSLVFAAAFHTAALYCAAVCFVLSVVFLLMNRISDRRTSAAALCCITACAAMICYTAVVRFCVLPITQEYDGKTAEFTGMIITEPRTTGAATSFTVHTDTVNGEKKHLNIRVSTSYALPAEIYDTIEGRAELSSIFEYGYGFASYYGARQVFLSTYINPYYGSEYTVCRSESRPFYAVFSDIRKAVTAVFTKYLAYDEAAVCTAVVTGDRQYLSDEVYDSFRSLGISHMLVVSGLHLSVAAGVLRRLCLRLSMNRYISAAVQISGIFAFALITGMGFSVIRALVMLSISILAQTLFERADALESLGIASTVLCIDPLNIGDVGMLWSFSCTLSLILFSEPIKKYIKKLFTPYRRIEFLTEPLANSAAAMAGSLPFLIFFTGTISPYTIIINTMLVPFTGVLIVCAAFGALCAVCGFMAAGYPLLFAAGVTAKCFTAAARWFDALPYSNIRIDDSVVGVWFAVSAVLIAAFGYLNKKKIHYAVVLSLSVLVGIFSIDTVITYDTVTLSVLDVGDGLAVTLKKNDCFVMLDAAGEKYRYSIIKSELEACGSGLCLMDTADTHNEYSYYRRIAKDFPIDKIIVCSEDKYTTGYSWQRYSGVDVVLDDYDIDNIDIADGVRVTLVRTSDNVWQYVTVYSHSVLICPPNSDYGLLPDEYKNYDYIIMQDIPRNLKPNVGAQAVISAYGESCSEAYSAVKSFAAVYATNGEGRIDTRFYANGGINITREYTGGVIQYARDK